MAHRQNVGVERRPEAPDRGAGREPQGVRSNAVLDGREADGRHRIGEATPTLAGAAGGGSESASGPASPSCLGTGHLVHGTQHGVVRCENQKP